MARSGLGRRRGRGRGLVRASPAFASRSEGEGLTGCILEVVLIDPNRAGRLLRCVNCADDPY